MMHTLSANRPVATLQQITMPFATHRSTTHSHRVVYTQRSTLWGPVTLAAHVKGLAGCWFEQQAHFPDLTNWQRDEQHPLLHEAHQQLQAFFQGSLHTFDVPLHPLGGTPFQQDVWAALQTITYGVTTTYADIARAVSRPRAVRAVGAAVGRNPLSVFIPCHRVLGSQGALTGYAGGLHRKQSLLLLESQHA